ncbi:hypothetical protein [Vibrio paracholerae]|uniref:hypothetical protein n=1 Tax=Vibrio paracholerae TaxID=650003 RepID=UPI00148271DC|nr:hypothetical protein [Vibrio paracholerae]
MTPFFTQSQTVHVSRITSDGWWIENTTEHVSKGTALGNDFTQMLYTPSRDGMIARYDRATGTWSDEIEDMTWKTYFDPYGNSFVIGEPDGQFPENAITQSPPEYDADSQTVLFKDGHWQVYPILLGRSFYDEYGNEFKVSDYNFELPENHTFIPPPEPLSVQHAAKLINGEWQQFLDHRGEMAYATDRDNGENYRIEELGELPATHTLTEPELYDSWSDGQWQYDIERHRPFKVAEEKQWRDGELTKVLDRIDQYEKDQSYPAELRTSPIKTEADYLKLLQDRKTLSDYPESDGFPFGQRPTLSSTANL